MQIFKLIRSFFHRLLSVHAYFQEDDGLLENPGYIEIDDDSTDDDFMLIY